MDFHQNMKLLIIQPCAIALMFVDQLQIYEQRHTLMLIQPTI